MTLADYRDDLAKRDGIRAGLRGTRHRLRRLRDARRHGAAPVGLGSTGITQLTVPASLLGTPALTLPVLTVDELPLGLQVMGFADRDADAFGGAAWLLDLF